MKLILLFALFVGVACSGDSDPLNRGSCARNTTYYGGDAPNCNVGLECSGTRWDLECAGDTCSCLEDGEPQKTVPYEDRFCAPDFDTGSENSDPYVMAASEVCGGWG